VFWLTEDFFSTVKLDSPKNTGANVVAAMRANYTRAEIAAAGYTEDELNYLMGPPIEIVSVDFTDGNGQPTNITPAKNSILNLAVQLSTNGDSMQAMLILVAYDGDDTPVAIYADDAKTVGNEPVTFNASITVPDNNLTYRWHVWKSLTSMVPIFEFGEFPVSGS